MTIGIHTPHISVLSVTNRDYGTPARYPAPKFGRFANPGGSWLLAERTTRNDILNNGLRAFRNLIALFNQRTP
jgi:hypothetical protein